MAIILLAILGFAVVLDVAYERPRPSKGSGPLSKWLRRRYLTKNLLVLPVGMSVFAAYFPIWALAGGLVAALFAHLFFWWPLVIYNIVDWLGEEDRYRRFKQGASEKGKALLARLKPAPQRPIPIPTN